MRRAFAALPSACTRLLTPLRAEFPPFLVPFEGEIVIFPPGPGAASSSMESNCPELATLITVPALFALVATRSPLLPLRLMGFSD